jgi:NADH dehydrogenase
MEDRKPCPRVVVLGAGFGGLKAAMRLSGLRRHRHECDIVVIDRRTRHLYTPWLYEVATGYFEKPGSGRSLSAEEVSLTEGVSTPFEDLKSQLAPGNISVLYDEVSGVDWTSREVRLSSGARQPFDQLVIALGAVPDFYGIPGLAEHAHPLYCLRDAMAIRRHLCDVIEKRRRNELPHVRIVVGGAGPTGVEFAGELAMFMRRLTRRGDLSVSDYSIELIEASSRPLPTFHPDMSGWVRKRLEKLGVKLLLDTCIKGAHKDHIVLVPRPLKAGESPEELICDIRPGSQKEVTTDLLVWAGGSRANPLVAALGLAVDARGRIEVDDTLAVRGQDGVWALGDCASLVDPASKRPVPPLAQAAIHQGRIVAENAMRAVRGEPPERYAFPHMHAIVPVGGSFAVAEVFGVRLRGRFVHLLRLAADARYFFTTLPFRSAWKMFRAAFGVFAKNA